MRKGLLIYSREGGVVRIELLPKLGSALGDVITIDIEHLANDYATPEAITNVDMVVARRSRSDEIKRWMCVQEIRIDSGGNVV